MTTTIGGFIDRHPRIALGLAVVLLIAVTASGVYAVVVPEEPTEMDRACMGEFGADWTSSGWSTVSYPPTIQCEGPDGQLGVMKMPKDIREQKNIVLDTDNRQTASGLEDNPE